MSPIREVNTEPRSFSDVVIEAFENRELVENFERLYGVQVSNWRPPRDAIEAMVDKATGNQPTINSDGARAFIWFVYEFVWTRLPDECFTDKVVSP